MLHEAYRRLAERIFTVTSRCERTSSRTVFFSERAEEDGIRRWLQGKRGAASDPRASSLSEPLAVARSTPSWRGRAPRSCTALT